MKITHLIDYFQPKVGYQETFLALEQIKKGHEVAVITSDRFYPFPDFKETYAGLLGDRIQKTGEFVEETIKTYRLFTIEIPGTNLIYLTGLSKILNRLNPDLVICHGVYSFTSFQIARIKKYNKFKLIYDTHSAAFNTNFNDSLFKKAYHAFHSRFIAQGVKNSSDAIFAIGKDEQDFICKDFGLFNSQVPVIPLGVDVNRFKPDVNRRILLRNKMGIGNQTVIVFSGKIMPSKNIHLIIDALIMLRNTSLFFLMIGGGHKEYVSHILKKAESRGIRIKHIPFIPNSELQNYFQISDFGIWPGDPSISILELLACGIPVILPKNTETEYLIKNKIAVGFNKNSITDLASNIRLLADKPDIRNNIGIKARNYIINYLSWEIVSQKIISLNR